MRVLICYILLFNNKKIYFSELTKKKINFCKCPQFCLDIDSTVLMWSILLLILCCPKENWKRYTLHCSSLKIDIILIFLFIGRISFFFFGRISYRLLHHKILFLYINLILHAPQWTFSVISSINLQ